MNRKTDLQLWDYLFHVSKHKDFWSEYHRDYGVYFQEIGKVGLFMKSPFLIMQFSAVKKAEDAFVTTIKSRMEAWEESHDLVYVERAYRQDFLLSYLKENAKKLSKKKINQLILETWEDTEIPSSAKETWDELFSFLSPNLLDRSALPEGEFTIYRGGEREGRSWTLDKEQGKWFAERFDEDEYLFQTATITADDVLFYSNDREEQEVVLKESAFFIECTTKEVAS